MVEIHAIQLEQKGQTARVKMQIPLPPSPPSTYPSTSWLPSG